VAEKSAEHRAQLDQQPLPPVEELEAALQLLAVEPACEAGHVPPPHGAYVVGHLVGQRGVRPLGQEVRPVGQARLRERSITQWENERSSGSRKTATSGMSAL
jgi:hypothetical protein